MLFLVPWLVILQIIGLAAVPWAFPILRGLPDRGYGVSKALGLLILVYAYWALVNAGFFSNGLLALVLVLLLYLAASGVLARQQWPELLHFMRSRWRLLLLEEMLFVSAFAAFAAFRVFVPDVTITTAITGLTTEQPMDLAFLTSALRSPSFPLNDPWLAGHPISYYYLGYLTLSLPARLVGVIAPVAYNLGLATVFALAAVGSFSLAVNTLDLSGFVRTTARRLAPLSVLGGVIALLLLLVSGNLSGGLQGLRLLFSGQGGGLSGNPNWWWDSTRIIQDGTHAEPIDEIPAFSFILGDLHPHLMSLPFALLALTLALGWLAKRDAPDARWPLQQPGELLLTSLVIGALGFINAWDMPTYFLVLAVAIAVRRLWDYQDVVVRTTNTLIGDILSPAAAIFLVGLLLFLPFYTSLDGGAQGILPVSQSGTAWSHYFRIWGPLLVAIPPVLLVAWARIRGKTLPRSSLVIVILLALVPTVSWLAIAIAWNLIPLEIAVAAPPQSSEILRRIFLTTAPIVIVAAALIALYPSRWEHLNHPGRAFLHILVLAGVAAILLPELAFVRDLFGTRMNTVFKLHYQAWLLLSIAGAGGMIWLLTRPWPRLLVQRGAIVGGIVSASLLIVVGVSYGPLAVATRLQSSPGPSTALDGLTEYRDRFPDEADAIDWLRENAPPNTVLLEAVGGDYTDFGRISAATGIPTLLGWEGHELQWRNGPSLYEDRREQIETIYTGTDAQIAQDLLAFYDVDYVFVGRLETATYGADVLERLTNAIPDVEEVFRVGDVAILRVPDEYD